MQDGSAGCRPQRIRRIFGTSTKEQSSPSSDDVGAVIRDTRRRPSGLSAAGVTVGGRPAPDPAQFGTSADDDGDRTNPLIRNMPAVNAYVPDYGALLALGDRVHLAVAAGSGREVAARGSHGLAERLGREVDIFPSHHAGFTAAEGPYPGEPEAFAARLRVVLADSGVTAHHT